MSTHRVLFGKYNHNNLVKTPAINWKIRHPTRECKRNSSKHGDIQKNLAIKQVIASIEYVTLKRTIEIRI